MNTSSNSYVLGFAVCVCVVMSASLAVVANGLKPIQDAAAEYDRQKNVMRAAGLLEANDLRPRAEIEQLYKDRVEEFVVDTETGDRKDDMTPGDVGKLKDEADKKRYRVVATATGDDGKLQAFVLPITCKGLWSTLRGYLALDADADHVRGITFYDQKETPGLGGEVENPKWTAQWVGKTILQDGKLVSVTVKKGAVNKSNPNEAAHYVDGLAGATITSNGVTIGVKQDLEAFETYLDKARSN